MAVYCNDNRDLIESGVKNLVESQFEQLKSLPEVYKLLCRLEGV
ncbi:hypothetical protein PN471_01385 [Aphanizomenon sp. CS-733/32]|nr:hypothetical protein [Aphanizomenon sp. CS-733/32]MDB9307331.1 hypothetical protein [Aphanizomenon sp. CS-733/32]